MFLIIPLAIFVVSISAIIWIVSRKFVYLKKLAPDAVEATVGVKESFWAELYPEIAAFFGKINLRSYGVNILNEFEKLLRRLRLVSLQADDFTNRLIHRVRTSSKKHEEILNKETAATAEEKAEAGDLLGELGDSAENLKQKEQLMIIEIAKSPKDADLYKNLGIIYMKTGEWQDAKQSFEKALELNPGDDIIKRKLGRVLGKLEMMK